MKIIYFFLLSFVNSKVIINNKNIPVCRNCIHFNPNSNSDFSSIISKCNKFADKDLKTDELIFNYADNCRSDESKCGKDGKYFEVEPNLQRKIFTHTIIHYTPSLLVISIYVYTFFIFYVISHIVN